MNDLIIIIGIWNFSHEKIDFQVFKAIPILISHYFDSSKWTVWVFLAIEGFPSNNNCRDSGDLCFVTEIYFSLAEFWVLNPHLFAMEKQTLENSEYLSQFYFDHILLAQTLHKSFAAPKTGSRSENSRISYIIEKFLLIFFFLFY